MYKKILIAILLLFGAFFSRVLATDYSSSNFIVRDPITAIGGGRSASGNFEVFGNGGVLMTGETLSSGFTVRSGFFYFPTATSPVIIATPGDGQVSLSWTGSIGTLANITNYQVGVAAASGGPYVYESVGNVLFFVKSGLTNGTLYYFRVSAQAGIETLATSGVVSATPISALPTPTPTPPPGGGGGGGGFQTPSTGVVVSGRAYPLSKVTLLKDGQVSATTIAGPDANFNISLANLSTGNYMFSVFGEDSNGSRSTSFTFPLFVTSGAVAQIGGIFVSPTIDVDKSEVKRGENIAIFGQSAPKSEVTIAVNSETESFVKAQSDKNGAYLYNFDTSPLEIGQHITKAKASLDGEISPFGKAVSFAVGTKTVTGSNKCGIGDLNCDGKVNLVDFSILLYWWKKPNTNADLNANGVVDLADFSIMLYWWTG